MSKINETIMLLLSVSTEDELKGMLQEEGWSIGTRQCIQEEIADRRNKTYDHTD